MNHKEEELLPELLQHEEEELLLEMRNWSNSGKSSSSLCDSHVFSSAAARKSLACEASTKVYMKRYANIIFALSPFIAFSTNPDLPARGLYLMSIE